MGFFGRLRKEHSLVRIMKVLGAPTKPENALAEILERVKSGVDPEDIAKNELFDIVCSDPDTIKVMSQFGIVRDDLDGLYTQLLLAGGGQWARNTWVAAGSLADHKTLNYVLTETRKPLQPPMSESERWFIVVSNLISLYQRS